MKSCNKETCKLYITETLQFKFSDLNQTKMSAQQTLFEKEVTWQAVYGRQFSVPRTQNNFKFAIKKMLSGLFAQN